MTRISPWRRIVVGMTAALLAAGLVSGCVYLRLQQLRRQLADFRANFRVFETADDIGVLCLSPVLLSRDVLSITRLSPTSRTVHGDTERWVYRFQKLEPSERAAPNGDDVPLTLVFRSNLLHEAHFPRRFRYFLAEESLETLFAPLTGAEIDEERRRVAWEAQRRRQEITRRENIEDLLGTPTHEKASSRGAVWMAYAYHVARDPDPAPRREDVWFRFTLAPDQTLVSSRIHVGGLRFEIGIRPTD